MLVILRALLGGIRLRCARCGEGGLLAHAATLSMRKSCPRCGWVFEREEGYWTGAVGINLVLDELLTSAVALLLWWQGAPLAVTLGVGMLIAVLFPILFYPFAKSFWMRFDLLVHPPTESREAERPAAPGLNVLEGTLAG
jgi:ribosomal protein S27AE